MIPRLALTLTMVTVSVVACGGSSSETPWPVEPDDVNLGPSGEAPAPGGKRTPAAPSITTPPPAPSTEPAQPSDPAPPEPTPLF